MPGPRRRGRARKGNAKSDAAKKRKQKRNKGRMARLHKVAEELGKKQGRKIPVKKGK